MFLFSISSELFPLNFPKAYLLLFSYGAIGISFVTAYGKNHGKKIYFLVTLLTIIGMACRYILEYGEVSNIYNFTVFNIILYAVASPVFTTSVYCLLPKIH